MSNEPLTDREVRQVVALLAHVTECTRDGSECPHSLEDTPAARALAKAVSTGRIVFAELIEAWTV